MNFLAGLLYEVALLLGKFLLDTLKKWHLVKESGEKAEADSEESVSDLMEEKDEKQKYPKIEQAKKFLARRRNRNTP